MTDLDAKNASTYELDLPLSLPSLSLGMTDVRSMGGLRGRPAEGGTLLRDSVARERDSFALTQYTSSKTSSSWRLLINHLSLTKFRLLKKLRNL